MSRVLKWLGVALGGLLVLTLVASLAMYLGRLGLVTGLYESLTGTIDTTVPRPAVTPDAPPEALGRYLALTSCSECHGQDLNGDSAFSTPSLTIVRRYPADTFATLLRTGVPLGGRKLELMADVALGRFAHFTDEEVAALYAYLHERD
jgi:mono/diheme cytochrome c family protein